MARKQAHAKNHEQESHFKALQSPYLLFKAVYPQLINASEEIYAEALVKLQWPFNEVDLCCCFSSRPVCAAASRCHMVLIY